MYKDWTSYSFLLIKLTCWYSYISLHDKYYSVTSQNVQVLHLSFTNLPYIHMWKKLVDLFHLAESHLWVFIWFWQLFHLNISFFVIWNMSFCSIYVDFIHTYFAKLPLHTIVVRCSTIHSVKYLFNSKEYFFCKCTSIIIYC